MLVDRANVLPTFATVRPEGQVPSALRLTGVSSENVPTTSKLMRRANLRIFCSLDLIIWIIQFNTASNGVEMLKLFIINLRIIIEDLNLKKIVLFSRTHIF
mgnify:CR=1 FL=1